MAATTASAPSTFDVLLEAAAAAGLHLAQVRGTGCEPAARASLDGLCRMLCDLRDQA